MLSLLLLSLRHQLSHTDSHLKSVWMLIFIGGGGGGEGGGGTSFTANKLCAIST
jgi:hypothetical protein